MSHYFDFVVFGATGFTGQFVVKEMLKVVSKRPEITFAIAGRDLSKMNKSLLDIIDNTKITLDKPIEKIICDISDPKSLRAMASQAKIVLNCVGPYRFYGRQVVEACIESGSHHLDISGEPEYLETMQLDFDALAQAQGVYVIGACGFDSIPAEAGVIALLKHSDQNNAVLNEVESFMEFSAPRGLTINSGTWQSAINGYANHSKLAPLRKKMYKDAEQPIKSDFRPKFRGVVSYENFTKGWIVPFPGSDKSVVFRSQRQLAINRNCPVVQYSPYVNVGSFCNAVLILIFGIYFGIMASIRLTRNLLIKYPKFFSFGVFTEKGPSSDQIAANSFKISFLSKGWEADSNFSSYPTRLAKCLVKGPDPGYVSCAICLVQCGLTLLEESSRMPKNGGVMAPGLAFFETTLLERLTQNGIEISVEE